MRRRLLLSTCLIALATVLVLGVPLGLVGTALLRQRADMRLERRADEAALRIARAQSRGTPLTFALVDDLLPADEALRVTRSDGRRITLGSLPRGARTEVASGDGGPLSVTLVAPAAAREDDVGIVWLAVAGSGLAALVAAIALASIQARRLAAPLEQLAGRVERLGNPDYDDRPVARQLAEIDQVQQALNDADRRIAGSIRREREFTANVSHQLRTPLTGLRLRLEELHRLADSSDATDEADAALQQVDRLVTTIEHLEAVARHRDDEPGLVDLGALVADHVVAGHWGTRFADAGRRLEVEAGAGLPAHVEPESARQILDVLLDNALRHGVGDTTVRTGRAAGWVRIAVGDAGRSLAGTGTTAIFARGVGHGSGIGLAVARELARRAGGDLQLVRGAPTTFEAVFRAAEERSAPAGPPQSPPS